MISLRRIDGGQTLTGFQPFYRSRAHRMHKWLAFVFHILYSVTFIFISLEFVRGDEGSRASAEEYPARHSIFYYWPEWTIVIVGSIVFYFLKDQYGDQRFVWPWAPFYGSAATSRLRVLDPNNAKNQLVFRRYKNAIALVGHVLVSYLWENVYFAFVVFFQLTCRCSPTGKHSTYPGLLVAFVAKLLLASWEEFTAWTQERQRNSAKYLQIRIDASDADVPDVLHWGEMESIDSGQIRRGKVVLVERNKVVPVDGILLASSENLTTPILFKEADLTGESAPVAKFPVNIGLDITEHVDDITDLEQVAKVIHRRIVELKPTIEVEEPTTSSVQFSGTVFQGDNNRQVVTFNAKNAAFRGSILHGSDWAFVLAVYTGHQTKAGLPLSNKPSQKDTPLNRQLAALIKTVNIRVIVLLSIIATAVVQRHNFLDVLSNPGMLLTFGFWSSLWIECIVNFLFLNGLNNLSTRFFGDIVRIGQCRNMMYDSHNFVEANRKIPDSLGNVEVIISDKTGTITKNALKCEQLLIAEPLDGKDFRAWKVGSPDLHRAVNASPVNGVVSQFVTFMALANGVLPKEESGSTHYYSSNPDDLEFVRVAKNLNLELRSRTTDEDAQQFAEVRAPYDRNGEMVMVDGKFRVLQEHEFVSSRKYMSVLIQPADHDAATAPEKPAVLLMLKGADEAVEPLLSDDSPFKGRISELVRPHTREGKRVLVWAYKFCTSQEYENWRQQRPTDPNDSLEDWWRLIERNVEFAGCTIIADELQDGVGDVIAYARNCGISVVMATGDSADTAESIWRKLEQIQGPVHKLVYSEIFPKQLSSSSSSNSNQDPLAKLDQAFSRIRSVKPADKAVLLLDSEMLASLNENYLQQLKTAMCNFDSVIAARMTAAQKAQINGLFQSLGKITLAIGDGANDISMIQEASVSVGLKSAETDTAANVADFKVQEFRNLQGLLVYGLQNYFRLSTVYLWNDYKAIVLALVPFFSRFWHDEGQSIIPGDLIFMLTTVLLSLPVVIFGIYDVPISVAELIETADHYKEYRSTRFDIRKKTLWWISAVTHTVVILAATALFPSYFHTQNALVMGVLTTQIIAVVTNVRLIFESRRGFHVSDSWRLLIASIASIFLTIPISNMNPAFDSERRLKLGGSLDLPRLGLDHLFAVVVVAFVCLLIDVVLYRIFDESHIIASSRADAARSPQVRHAQARSPQPRLHAD